jgi:hypothetical protein
MLGTDGVDEELAIRMRAQWSAFARGEVHGRVPISIR